MAHFNQSDLHRNQFMLTGKFSRKGYDWWWHSFTGIDEETGEERPFFVEFFTCNPFLARSVPTFGQLPENQKNRIRPSYLMVKAGSWGKDKRQLHRFFSWKDVKLNKKAPYSIEAADCFCSETELRGSIHLSEGEVKKHPEWMCDDGTMKWNLKLEKKVAFNVGYGAGWLFRALKAFEMYWHAEGMKTLVSGTVKYQGRTYVVKPETSYGYSDKNWGSNFTSPWVWLSSNNLTSKVTGKKLEDSVFDIGGGCPKVFGIPLKRKLLSAFWYEGKPFEYNFSKFWTHTRTKFSFREEYQDVVWNVEQSNRKSVMVTEIHCLKKDMLFVNYESPDGKKRHHQLWNGGNGFGNIKLYRKNRKAENGLELIDDIDVKNVGCEYGEYGN